MRERDKKEIGELIEARVREQINDLVLSKALCLLFVLCGVGLLIGGNHTAIVAQGDQFVYVLGVVLGFAGTFCVCLGAGVFLFVW